MARTVARRVRWAAAVTCAVGLVASCAAGPRVGPDGEVALKMADSFAQTHPIGRSGTTTFLDGLRAEGPAAGIEVEYYANGQMGKQRDMPSLLRSDVVQIAPVLPAYVSAELPMSSVADLPGLVVDSCAGADAVLGAMGEGSTLFEKELQPKGIRPLWAAVLTDVEAMPSREVREPSDLDGMLLRSTGGVADKVIDDVGAAVVSMPLGELYEAISRGTVDGAVTAPMSVTPYRLGEVLDYTTRGARLGSFTALYAVSEDTWQQLDDRQQELLTDMSAKAQQSACEEISAATDASFEELEEDGVTIVDIPEGDRPKWEAIAGPVRQSWVRDLEGRGLPAGEVLDEFTAALEAAR